MTGLDAWNSRSTPALTREDGTEPAKQFFACIENDGYAASLEKRKIYLGRRGR
jgi:hypothetical protein